MTKLYTPPSADAIDATDAIDAIDAIDASDAMGATAAIHPYVKKRCLDCLEAV